MQLQPSFHFLEVAYPYVARRLLTDEDPALRERLFQVPYPPYLFCRLHLGLCPCLYARSFLHPISNMGMHGAVATGLWRCIVCGT